MVGRCGRRLTPGPSAPRTAKPSGSSSAPSLPPKRPDTWTGKIDSVLLHPVSGVLILLAILFLMFQAVFSWATPLMDLIKAGFDWLALQVTTYLPHGLLESLLADGIISGVGSVLVFLPQIMILFFFIILLKTSATWPGRRS